MIQFYSTCIYFLVNIKKVTQTSHEPKSIPLLLLQNINCNLKTNPISITTILIRKLFVSISRFFITPIIAFVLICDVLYYRKPFETAYDLLVPKYCFHQTMTQFISDFVYANFGETI
jgi:hypothetical protein